MEEIAHRQTADEHRDHRAPRSDAREEQDRRADQDRQRRSLAHAARNETEEGVHGRIAHLARGAQVFERRCAGEAVHHALAGGHARDPHRRARHRGRIGEEGEGARQQRGIEDVHARTAEHLLAEDDGEGGRESHHPERNVHRHDHRDQQTRHQEALVDLVAAELGECELDAQTHDVRNDDQGEHLEESEPERSPEFGLYALREEMQVTRVIETEQKRRHQGDDHHDHRTLHVVAVADMRAFGSRRVGYEQERFERIERRFQEAQLATLGERGLELVY